MTLNDHFYLVSLTHARNRQNKARFHQLGRTILQRLARQLNLKACDRDIRSNQGGPAIMGEIILHTDEFYLQVSDRGIMFRTCNGRRDYSGDVNHFWDLTAFDELKTLAVKIRAMVRSKAFALKH
jgi:hypothetical protein